MIEVLRTTDPVQLSYAMALLEDAGLHPFVADRYISAVEGGISAFPRRVLVPDECAPDARAILEEMHAAGPVDAAVDADDDVPPEDER